MDFGILDITARIDSHDNNKTTFEISLNPFEKLFFSVLHVRYLNIFHLEVYKFSCFGYILSLLYKVTIPQSFFISR